MKKNYTFAIILFIGLLLQQSSLAQIVAVDDNVVVAEDLPPQQVLANVLANDLLNGNPITLSDVTLTQVYVPTFSSVILQPNGTVNSSYSLDAGSYIVVYQICDVADPSNCDTATVTVVIGDPAVTAVIGSVTTPTCANPTSNITVNQLDTVLFNDPWFIDLYVNSLPWGDTFEGDSANAVFSGVPPGFVRIIVSSLIDAVRYATIEIYIEAPENCGPDGIRLNAFVDTNENGVKDGSEIYFSNGSFHTETNDDGITHDIYSPSGQYVFYDDNPLNTYDFYFTTYDEGCNGEATSTSVYSNVNVIVSSGIMDYDFPIISLPCTNLSVNLYGGHCRPGQFYSNYVLYRNLGTQTITSGTITFIKPSATTSLYVGDSTAIISPTGFTYDFVNLAPNESRLIYVSMFIPNIPIVSIGDQLTSTVTITIPPGDNYPANNSDTYIKTIATAYDPNDIHESHNGKILFSSFTGEDYLTYTIRFENTGNADANQIVVTDALDAMLDESSIQMVAASGNYILDRVSNQLTWTFDNISLPPSIPDSDIGKGFIVFKIKPKSGYAIGDIIPNSANIYFDTNPAIETNTFNTEFVAELSVNEFDVGDFAVFPNPTRNILNISNGKTSIDSLTVIDIYGKVVLSKKINKVNAGIDLSQLSNGLYFVTIKSDGNQQTIKVLKE